MKNFNAYKEKQIEEKLYAFLPKENFSGSFEVLRPIFANFNKKYIDKKVPIITIGGTNGKGETCFFLKTLLENQGHKVAVFTSPHVLSLSERFYFNGSNLSYACLSKLIDECGKELKNFSLSFYEFVFYMFCSQLDKVINQIDFIILEVGLGGRKDTVNLLSPSLCALTSISRDHQEILGYRYDQILFEKLGITRSGIPLVTFFKNQYLNERTQLFCNKKNIEVFNIQKHREGSTLESYSARNRFQANILFHLLFNDNLEHLPLKIKDIEKEPEKGRFELMTLGKIRFIFIGAHNIDGIRLLEKTILSKVNGNCLPFDEFWISFSKRELKDIEAAIKIFKGYDLIYKKLWLTSFSHTKAFEISDDVRKKIKTDLPSEMDWVERLTIMNRDVNKTIAITGSYYFIGEVQKSILQLGSKDN